MSLFQRKRGRAIGFSLAVLLGLLLVTPVTATMQLTPLSVPELPPTIPLFPLPNVAILPYLQLPLRIFEPRYLQMLTDTMASDHVIGLVQLQPGFEADYQGRPPIFSIGCAAVVVNTEQEPGGEFQIVLRGFVKFRITSETGGKSYRLARVEPILEPVDTGVRTTLSAERPILEAAIATSLGVEPASLRLPPLSDEDLVNSLVMNLDFDTVDRQVLIEQPGVLARARKLTELLQKAGAEPSAPRR